MQRRTIKQTTTQTLAPMVNLGRPCRCTGPVIPSAPKCNDDDEDE